MACIYQIKIAGQEGVEPKVLSIPSGNNLENYSTEVFIQDIKNNKLLWENVILQAEEAYENIIKSESKNPNLIIQSRDHKDALYNIANKLSQLGIKVTISDSVTQSGAISFVQNGEIFLSPKANLEAPIHELLHLVFGVMRVENPKYFTQIMQSLETSQHVADQMKKVQTYSAYSNLLHEDLVEEAFVRVIENLLNDNLDVNEVKVIYDGNETLLYDFLDMSLTDSISKTFGVPKNKLGRISKFLKAPISHLPLLGSTMFQRSQLKSNGYSDKQKKAHLGAKVTNFIQQQIKKGIITEGEC